MCTHCHSARARVCVCDKNNNPLSRNNDPSCVVVCIRTIETAAIPLIIIIITDRLLDTPKSKYRRDIKYT